MASMAIAVRLLKILVALDILAFLVALVWLAGTAIGTDTVGISLVVILGIGGLTFLDVASARWLAASDPRGVPTAIAVSIVVILVVATGILTNLSGADPAFVVPPAVIAIGRLAVLVLVSIGFAEKR
jgi:hypothetical protein